MQRELPWSRSSCKERLRTRRGWEQPKVGCSLGQVKLQAGKHGYLSVKVPPIPKGGIAGTQLTPSDETLEGYARCFEGPSYPHCLGVYWGLQDQFPKLVSCQSARDRKSIFLPDFPTPPGSSASSLTPTDGPGLCQSV